jgi:hypothetical protein
MIIKQKRGYPDVFMEKISYDEYRRRVNHATYWYNLTPHPVNLIISEIPPRSMYDVHRVLCVEFPASGNVARVEFGDPDVLSIDGFKVHENVPVLGVVYLPEKKENVMLLVSALVREQLRGQKRDDVFSPDTGITALRNDKGAIFAVRALQRA